MLRTSPLRALALALALITGFTTVGSANHSWGTYHWARHNNPFTLAVGDNVTAAWDQYLDEAVLDWSVSSVLDLIKAHGTSNPATCHPRAGRIEVCNAAYGNTGWLGIAQIWITGVDHIYQATTRLNDTYFNQPQYNTQGWRRLVMCQEIGHDFGLDHQDEDFTNPNLGTCMDYTNAPEGPPSNERPNQHDYDQIEIIYAHSDPSGTVGHFRLPSSIPPAMNQIHFAGRSQWGQLVHSSLNGRLQHFDLDFGGGNHVITHVWWR